MGADQPIIYKDSESSPTNIIKNPGNATFISATVKSGIGPVDPGDVLGKDSGTNDYAQTVKATILNQASGTATLDVDTAALLSSGTDVIIDYNGSNVESGTVINTDTTSSPETVTLSSNVSNVHASGTTVRADNGTHVAEAIYPGDKPIEQSGTLNKGPVNTGLARRGLVEKSDLNHSDSAAESDLKDHFTFK